MPRYYPINIDIEEAKCLVVGGGNVAERKVCTLLSYKAIITIISPQITTFLKDLAEKKEIAHYDRPYQKGDCKGMRLIIVATDSELINQEVAKEAIALNCLVNVVDQPQLSNFIVPATVKRGDLQISISTNGRSPALARRIRERLEEEFGPEYEEFLRFTGDIREMVMTKIQDAAKRREFFFALVDSDIIEMFKQERKRDIQIRLEELFERFML